MRQPNRSEYIDAFGHVFAGGVLGLFYAFHYLDFWFALLAVIGGVSFLTYTGALLAAYMNDGLYLADSKKKPQKKDSGSSSD